MVDFQVEQKVMRDKDVRNFGNKQRNLFVIIKGLIS